MRYVSGVLAGLLLATVVPEVAQATATSEVVLPAKGTLNADGSVDITMKVRCNETQLAYEWSIDLRQGDVYGNDFAGPVAGVIPCNGKLQTVQTHVVGANGPYVAGTVNVQALVELADVGGGGDTELEDRAVVRLRP